MNATNRIDPDHHVTIEYADGSEDLATWAEFADDNSDSGDPCAVAFVREVEIALLVVGSYTDGGGAQPLWTVRLA